MKRIALILAMAAAVIAMPAGAQKKKNDKDKQNQLASMEYIQWKFTPESYYYSWYWQKIIFFKIKLPGLGVHDNGFAGLNIPPGDDYVNEEWRKMTPIRAGTALETLGEVRKRTETDNQWTSLMQKDLIEIADNSLDLTGSYSTARSRLNKCRQRLASYRQLTSYQQSQAEDELLFINQSIEDIYTSGMGSSRKMDGYSKQILYMEKLERKYYRINLRNACSEIAR